MTMAVLSSFGPGFWILVVTKLGLWVSTFHRKFYVTAGCHAVEKMTTNSDTLKRGVATSGSFFFSPCICKSFFPYRRWLHKYFVDSRAQR